MDPHLVHGSPVSPFGYDMPLVSVLSQLQEFLIFWLDHIILNIVRKLDELLLQLLRRYAKHLYFGDLVDNHMAQMRQLVFRLLIAVDALLGFFCLFAKHTTR